MNDNYMYEGKWFAKVAERDGVYLYKCDDHVLVLSQNMEPLFHITGFNMCTYYAHK